MRSFLSFLSELGRLILAHLLRANRTYVRYSCLLIFCIGRERDVTFETSHLFAFSISKFDQFQAECTVCTRKDIPFRSLSLSLPRTIGRAKRRNIPYIYGIKGRGAEKKDISTDHLVPRNIRQSDRISHVRMGGASNMQAHR